MSDGYNPITKIYNGESLSANSMIAFVPYNILIDHNWSLEKAIADKVSPFYSRRKELKIYRFGLYDKDMKFLPFQFIVDEYVEPYLDMYDNNPNVMKGMFPNDYIPKDREECRIMMSELMAEQMKYYQMGCTLKFNEINQNTSNMYEMPNDSEDYGHIVNNCRSKSILGSPVCAKWNETHTPGYEVPGLENYLYSPPTFIFMHWNAHSNTTRQISYVEIATNMNGFLVVCPIDSRSVGLGDNWDGIGVLDEDSASVVMQNYTRKKLPNEDLNTPGMMRSIPQSFQTAILNGIDVPCETFIPLEAGHHIVKVAELVSDEPVNEYTPIKVPKDAIGVKMLDGKTKKGIKIDGKVVGFKIPDMTIIPDNKSVEIDEEITDDETI